MTLMGRVMEPGYVKSWGGIVGAMCFCYNRPTCQTDDFAGLQGGFRPVYRV